MHGRAPHGGKPRRNRLVEEAAATRLAAAHRRLCQIRAEWDAIGEGNDDMPPAVNNGGYTAEPAA